MFVLVFMKEEVEGEGVAEMTARSAKKFPRHICFSRNSNTCLGRENRPKLSFLDVRSYC